MTKNIFLSIRGTPFGAKIAAHKTDGAQLVIKSKHPEVGAILAATAGAQILESKQGGHYFLTFVNKEDLMTNLGEALHEVAVGNVTIATKEDSPAPTFNSLGDASELDDDLGLDDDDESFDLG
jgi:hypothetical protein